MRINRLTGGIAVLGEGPAMVLPLLQELRRYPLRDQVYKPTASASAEGAAPFQTVEGLSVGVSVAVRYALDRDRAADIAKRLPDERRAGADRAGRRRRAAPFAGQAHRARDLHGQAGRDSAGHRAGAARRCWPRTASRCASLFIGPRRSARAVPDRAGGAAGRGAGDREDALHAAAQGEAGQGEVAGGATPPRSSARRPPRPPRSRRSSPPRRARRR